MYQKSIILTHQQIDIQKKIFECTYCNRPICKSGYFIIFKDAGIKYFCSEKCSNYEIKRREKLICAHCGESFENLNNGYKRKYCSKLCNINGHYSRYKKFNWCFMCNDWIRKENSIFKPAGTIIQFLKSKYKTKQDNYYCPICHNRLRVRKWAKKKSKNAK